jgi:hypothetical protein
MAIRSGRELARHHPDVEPVNTWFTTLVFCYAVLLPIRAHLADEGHTIDINHIHVLLAGPYVNRFGRSPDAAIEIVFSAARAARDVIVDGTAEANPRHEGLRLLVEGINKGVHGYVWEGGEKWMPHLEKLHTLFVEQGFLPYLVAREQAGDPIFGVAKRQSA